MSDERLTVRYFAELLGISIEGRTEAQVRMLVSHRVVDMKLSRTAPTCREHWERILPRAEEAADSGDLEDYLQYLEWKKTRWAALAQVCTAWEQSGIDDRLDLQKVADLDKVLLDGACVPPHLVETQRVVQLNDRMGDAYKAVAEVAFGPMDSLAYRVSALPTALAKALSAVQAVKDLL